MPPGLWKMLSRYQYLHINRKKCKFDVEFFCMTMGGGSANFQPFAHRKLLASFPAHIATAFRSAKSARRRPAEHPPFSLQALSITSARHEKCTRPQNMLISTRLQTAHSLESAKPSPANYPVCFMNKKPSAHCDKWNKRDSTWYFKFIDIILNLQNWYLWHKTTCLGIWYSLPNLCTNTQLNKLGN